MISLQVYIGGHIILSIHWPLQKSIVLLARHFDVVGTFHFKFIGVHIILSIHFESRLGWR